MRHANMLLRPAQPDDALAVAQVHVRSWQVAYRDLLPAEYLDRLRAEERAEKYDFASRDARTPRTIVAAEGDTILGFATTAPSRDRDLLNWGELCALYVDPEHWGRGIGPALIAAARERLSAEGFHNALLWVLDGNIRAERFYRNDGWRPDGAHRTEEVWGITIQELRFGRTLGASPYW